MKRYEAEQLQRSAIDGPSGAFREGQCKLSMRYSIADELEDRSEQQNDLDYGLVP